MTAEFDDNRIVDRLLSFLESTNVIDICIESKRTNILLNSKVKNQIRKSKVQGKRIRIVTGINMGNLFYCKALLQILDDESFPSLSDIKNSFAINESQYIVIFDSETNALATQSHSSSNIQITSINNNEIVNQ